MILMFKSGTVETYSDVDEGAECRMDIFGALHHGKLQEVRCDPKEQKFRNSKLSEIKVSTTWQAGASREILGSSISSQF